MNKLYGLLLVAGMLSSLAVMQVMAAETGIIEGYVVDASGNPLPGVTITAESAALQGSRTTETNADGRFRLPILPVGRYSITSELMGFAPLKKTNVPVRLGSTTTVEISMTETAVKEVMIVEATAPLIEKKSADLSMSITGEELSMLPSSDRSFRDIAKFVPGVTGVRINTGDGTTNSGYPSIRGEGQYGNNYLIDGLSVRDPAVNSTGTPMNYDAIEEVQVITDGFSPEYGQSLGGTINVITKSGSNKFGGEVALLYESDVLAGEETDSEWATNRDYTDFKPYLNFGGPIVRDKLWYFVSYNHFDQTDAYPTQTQDQYVISGADQANDSRNFFGKLTYGINTNNTLSLSGTLQASEEDHRGIEELRTDEAQGEMTTDQKRIRINYKSLISPTTVLEAKYGWIDRELEDKPMSGDTGSAQYRDLSTGVKYGNYDNTDLNTRGRNDFALIGTKFVDDFYGNHEIKTGLGYYMTESMRDLQFTGSAEDLFPERMEGGAEFLYRDGNPYRYYDYAGAQVVNETHGYTFFIQDEWSPIESLNVMAGLRLDTQVVENDVGKTLMEFQASDTIAPRLSLSWDITKDGKNIAKFGAGRFYDVVTTSVAEWGNTHNPYSYDYYQYGGPGNPYTSPDEQASWDDAHNRENWGRWRDTNGNGSYEEDEFFPGDPYASQDPSHNPILYQDVKPPYKDEFLLEYDRVFGDNYAVKVRYVEAHTRDLIDDVQFNPDEDDWRIINYDLKKRDYKAYELEFIGRPLPKLAVNLSYVNSSAKGTNPGQFERGGFQSTWGSGNAVGVFGDRPIPDYNGDGTVDDDEAYWQEVYEGLGGLDGDDGWYGYLPYSADHEVKLNSNYMAPYGIVLGVGFEWNSGYHWQARGFQEAYGGYLSFPEGRGAREMPSIYWFDLSISKRFTIYKQQYLTAKLDIFNVTDNNTAVSYWQELNSATFDYNGDGQIDWRDAYNDEDNSDFGKILKRQDPRSARITLSYTF